MAGYLTANFEADFSSFYEACQKAVVELKSFETGASQVEDKLDRMSNRFSGQKVIQDAQLMTEAIERLGGTSTLTEAELARVGKTANEAVEKMKALGMDVPKGMQELADATKTTGDETQSLTGRVTELAAGYLTAEAAIRVVEGAYEMLVSATKAVINSASEAEEADASLLAALRAQGTAVPSVVAAYDDYAAALQRTTKYSDDAVKAAEAILVQVGGVMPKDMERAIKATADLATVLKVDLSSAAMQVAKAAEGQTGALSKAGVVITENKDGTTDFVSVLDQLETKLHGAAEAAGNTFAGSLAKLTNAWDNVLEATGRVIVNNATWAAAVEGITTIVADNTTELNENATANNLVSDAVILTVEGLALLVDALDAVQRSVNEDIGFFHSLGAKVQEFAIYTAEAARAASQLTAIMSSGIVRENAIEQVNRINEYLELAHSRLEAHTQAVEDARTRSEAWSSTLGGLRGQLDDLVGKLAETRGQTRGLTADAEENDSVWKLITENMKANADANKKANDEAAAAAKKHAEAVKELAGFGTSWNAVLADMNAETIMNVASALELGASQETIANAMNLTIGQVKAVAGSMKEGEQAAKDYAKANAVLKDIQADFQIVMSELEDKGVQGQLDNIDAVTAAREASLANLKEGANEAIAELHKVADAEKELLIKNTLEKDKSTKAYYEKVAKDAENAYQFAMKHDDEFTAKSLDNLRKRRDAAENDLANWESVADKALAKMSGAADATAGAMGGVTAELGNMFGVVIQGSVQAGEGMEQMLYDMQHLTSAWTDMAGGPGGGWIRSEGFGSAAALNRNAGYRAAGGPVSAGASYVVGEKGPELFTPAANGTITPNGGGSVRVVVEAGALTFNYPIVNNPQALDHLARTVGDAIMSRVTRAGARL